LLLLAKHEARESEIVSALRKKKKRYTRGETETVSHGYEEVEMIRPSTMEVEAGTVSTTINTPAAVTTVSDATLQGGGTS
jgi:hypothetical protein